MGLRKAPTPAPLTPKPPAPPAPPSKTEEMRPVTLHSYPVRYADMELPEGEPSIIFGRYIVGSPEEASGPPPSGDGGCVMSPQEQRAILDYNPCADDRDVDVRVERVRIVTTRAKHYCGHGSHWIPAGTKARFSTAVVDGTWRSMWVCVQCVEEYLDEWEEGWRAG
jgi:hypothetical protein